MMAVLMIDLVAVMMVVMVVDLVAVIMAVLMVDLMVVTMSTCSSLSTSSDGVPDGRSDTILS